jgi:hypothetical protein
MSLQERLRQLEQRHDPDAPREYEVWIDEVDTGTIRNVRTGERVTIEEFEHRGATVIPVTLNFDRPMVDVDEAEDERGTP